MRSTSTSFNKEKSNYVYTKTDKQLCMFLQAEHSQVKINSLIYYLNYSNNILSPAPFSCRNPQWKYPYQVRNLTAGILGLQAFKTYKHYIAKKSSKTCFY